MAIRERSSSYQADVSLPNGKRIRRQFKTETEARLWEARSLSDIAEGRPVGGASPAPRRAETKDLISLAGLCSHIQRSKWANQRAGDWALRNARAAVSYFGHDADIRDIIPADIDEYATFLSEDVGNSPATVNRKLSALSTLFRTAHRNEVIPHMPHIPWRAKGEGRTRYLTDEEEDRLLAYWRQMEDTLNETFTIFLIHTGARAFSEAGRLRWSDISNRGATFWLTKTGKARTVPLSEPASKVLKRRKEAAPDSQGPFYGLESKHIRPAWGRMRGRLEGFKDVTPHVMRHTCATRLALGGADPRRIQVWMGHKNVNTTMRYIQMADYSLENLVAVLEDREARLVA